MRDTHTRNLTGVEAQTAACGCGVSEQALQIEAKPFDIGEKIGRLSRCDVSLAVANSVDAALLCKTRKASCLE